MVFMACNIVVSMMALIRYDQRSNGTEASSSWQITMDRMYDDAAMQRIYPNAVSK